NDKGRLNPDTRKRVRDVAERLGYKPNPAARSLVSGKTGLIAVNPSRPKQTRASFSHVGYFTAPTGAEADLADPTARHAVLRAAHGQESIAEVTAPAEMDRDEASATTRSVERLFDRTEAPDAVYVPLEIVGVEVLRAMLGMRLAIPDDVLLATTHDRGQARTA